MSDIGQVLGREVDKARELMPFCSNIVTSKVAPTHGILLGKTQTDPNGVVVTEARRMVREERDRVVSALRDNYRGELISWFCEQVTDTESPQENLPHLAIVKDIILPNEGVNCLTVAGLAVVIALYDLDEDHYRQFPRALLVDSREPNVKPFTHVSEAMRRPRPADFAIM
ncbi:MAG: hypothetical protein AAB914_02390 [Patescibacteria group bacterium]